MLLLSMLLIICSTINSSTALSTDQRTGPVLHSSLMISIVNFNNGVFLNVPISNVSSGEIFNEFSPITYQVDCNNNSTSVFIDCANKFNMTYGMKFFLYRRQDYNYVVIPISHIDIFNDNLHMTILTQGLVSNTVIKNLIPRIEMYISNTLFQYLPAIRQFKLTNSISNSIIRYRPIYIKNFNYITYHLVTTIKHISHQCDNSDYQKLIVLTTSYVNFNYGKFAFSHLTSYRDFDVEIIFNKIDDIDINITVISGGFDELLHASIDTISLTKINQLFAKIDLHRATKIEILEILNYIYSLSHNLGKSIFVSNSNNLFIGTLNGYNIDQIAYERFLAVHHQVNTIISILSIILLLIFIVILTVLPLLTFGMIYIIFRVFKYVRK